MLRSALTLSICCNSIVTKVEISTKWLAPRLILAYQLPQAKDNPAVFLIFNARRWALGDGLTSQPPPCHYERRRRTTPPCDKHITWQVSNAKLLTVHLLQERRSWLLRKFEPNAQIHNNSLLTVKMICKRDFVSGTCVFVSCVLSCSVLCLNFVGKLLTIQFACVGICWWPHSLNPKPTDWMAVPQCPLSPCLSLPSFLYASLCLLPRERLWVDSKAHCVSEMFINERGAQREHSCYLKGLIANLFVNTVSVDVTAQIIHKPQERDI